MRGPGGTDGPGLRGGEKEGRRGFEAEDGDGSAGDRDVMGHGTSDMRRRGVVSGNSAVWSEHRLLSGGDNEVDVLNADYANLFWVLWE